MYGNSVGSIKIVYQWIKYFELGMIFILKYQTISKAYISYQWEIIPEVRNIINDIDGRVNKIVNMYSYTWLLKYKSER